MNYDLIIIGGGPAGYTAGERAGAAGKKVLLVEKNKLGGVCLNEGCISTKTLLCSAKLKVHAENGKKYGVETADVTLNHKRVMARKAKTIKKLTGGIKIKLRRYNVDIINGAGYIKEKRNDGYVVTIGDEEFSCTNILIATGSGPIIPPVDGVSEAMEEGFAVTNSQVLELMEVPQRMVIIGGGVIGLEIAAYYKSAGSEITIIEMQDKIGGSLDGEIADILRKECEKREINFVMGAKVNKIGGNKVYYKADGETSFVECDKVLLSVGRQANMNGLGLEALGMETDKGIIIDERMRTSAEGIYAAGDVTAKSMLAHTAYRQAEVAVNNILGIDDIMEYNAVPAIIYTEPEVASVGLTKAQAEQKGLDVIEQSLSMNYSGRYMAENEAGQGIGKIIVERNSKKLLGVHLIGSYVSEMIYGAGIMIEQGFTLDDIKRQIFPHPTVSEIIREAAFAMEKDWGSKA